MNKKTKMDIWLIISITLVLIASPLVSKEVPAAPKPQGTLRVALNSLGEEAFLPDMGDIEQSYAWTLVYEFLYHVETKTRKFIPMLAERFEYSKDGLTLTVYLRKNVPWQEGWGMVTADDVKYTFERLMREGSTSIVKPVLTSTVKRMEVVDRYVLAFHLKEPAPEFWVQVFGPGSPAPPILCKKYIETVGEDKARFHPIGSGPYRLVERKSGEYLKFEAADKHWQVVPEFKYIVLQIVPEESTRVAMLKTGATDIATISAQSMADLQGVPGISVSLWPGGYSILACFGGFVGPGYPKYEKGYHRTDPWVDIRVREAMCMAIDRNAIVKAIYKGAAKPMSIGWTLPGWEELPPIPYDPKRAKQLLTEAGYPEGFEVKVVATTGWAPAYEMPQVMEAVAGYFEAVGLKVKIVPMDKAQQFSMNRAYKDVGFIYPWKEDQKVSWAARHLTKFVPGAWPVLFSSDEFTALINEYEAEPNFEKRNSLLKRIRDYHYKHYVTIPIAAYPPVFAIRNKVVGEWPECLIGRNLNLAYIRHVKPLNTWRLFTP